uniref:Uncharacterized protein n=1 Tax=Parascaris equorum TaxID=6256 RepID=A0A914RZ98_PAREQ
MIGWLENMMYGFRWIYETATDCSFTNGVKFDLSTLYLLLQRIAEFCSRAFREGASRGNYRNDIHRHTKHNCSLSNTL